MFNDLRSITRVLALGLFAFAGTVNAGDDPLDLTGDWRAYARSEHIEALEESEALAATALDAVPADAYGQPDRQRARALLDAKRRPLSRDDLIRDWRCRSIQAGELGVFAYPFFKCRIQRRGEGLYFEKLTGSQRRSGWLFTEGETFVMLAGFSVNDDVVNRYSGLPGGAAPDSDSAGRAYGLADGRVLILFDATPDNVEFYELAK